MRISREEGIKTEAEEHGLSQVDATKVYEDHIKERPDYYEGLHVVERAPPGYYFHVPASHWLQLRVGVLVVLLLAAVALATWLGGGTMDAAFVGAGAAVALYCLGAPYLRSLLG